MTNTKLLEKAIKESGIEKSTIAKEIGLTEKTFAGRISGKTSFKASEVNTLCKILKIETPTEATKIFFADNQEEGNTAKKELHNLVEKLNDSQALYLLTLLKKLFETK